MPRAAALLECIVMGVSDEAQRRLLWAQVRFRLELHASNGKRGSGPARRLAEALPAEADAACIDWPD